MSAQIVPERDTDGFPLQKSLPFASNKTPEGETLFVKVHGMSADVPANSSHTFEFDIPYTKALYNGAEIFTEVKAQTNLNVEVFDGVSSYIPYEQYGFDVCAGEFYSRETSYYSTVMLGVKLKCTVTNHESVTKKMGINFLLHEARGE